MSYATVPLLMLLACCLALSVAQTCNAWEVEVTSDCQYTANIYVTGEHLFWQQIDCTDNRLKKRRAPKMCSAGGNLSRVYIG